jgi:hypothetical protein
MRVLRRIPRSAVLIAMLFVVLSTILYWPFVVGGKALFWGTPMLQFWPWRRFAAQELRAGRLPLWNPHTGNGTPLLADHQSAVLYPPNLIFWLMPVERAMGLSVALHAVLAGLAMYALSRDLGLTRGGGVVAALAFMFSGYMVARGSFLTEVSALPWLPLLWLYGGRLVRRFRMRDLLLLSLVIAIQFLAGHAQTWFYSLVSLALYGAWRGVEADDRGRIWGRIWRAVVRCWPLLAGVGWGIALAGMQFLPTFELSYLAGRSGRADWETYALQYSLWPWRLITLLLPDFFGNPARGDYWGYATYWEDAGYVGVLPFALALLAIVAWFWWRHREQGAGTALHHAPPFVLLALFSLLMALGKNTPFYLFFFRYVPGFDAFQAPARWLCVYTPAVAVLSGIGADVLRRSQRLTFVCRLAAVGAVGIGLTALAGKWMLSEAKATFFGPLIQFAILFAVSMVLFLLGQAAREGKTLALGSLRLGEGVWQAVVVLFVAGDLIYAGYCLNPAVDPALYEAGTTIGAFLQDEGPRGRTFYLADAREAVMWEQFLDFGDYGPADAAFWRGMREALLPDLGMAEALPSGNSFEPLVEERYYALVQAVEDADRETAWRTLGAMNVAYVLDPASHSDKELAHRSPWVNVYRNPYLLARAYVVHRVRPAGTAEEALAALLSPEFDPAQEAIIEAPGAAPMGSEGGAVTFEPVTLLLSPPNRVTIRATLAQPGFLVLADTFYPGWQVRVDGERVKVLRANYAFRAVALDAGEHDVRFVYRPLAVTLGFACTGVALAGLLVVWIWLRQE